MRELNYVALPMASCSAIKNLDPGLLMQNAARLLPNWVLRVQPESRGEGVELSANAKNVCDVAGREFIRSGRERRHGHSPRPIY